MELSVTDGMVRFCKYRISCTIPDAPEEGPDPFRERLGGYRVEEYGLLAYNDDELADIRNGLDDLDITYTVEDISPTPDQVIKAQELAGKVSTRSEAMRYIAENVLPEDVALQRRLQKLEDDVEDLKEKEQAKQGG